MPENKDKPPEPSKPKPATEDNAALVDPVARTIRTLWANGIIVSHQEEMLHSDGMHRFELSPVVRDEKLAATTRQVLADILVILHGLLPKDAKVNK